ncbi:MAG: serine hydrolase [Chloroflexi bacterium]|nr:serine hydrolase [Chloroflexota bacterium]
MKNYQHWNTPSSDVLDQALEKITAQYPYAGLAIGVVDQEKIIYTQSFGYQNLDTKIPISPVSLFSIASISKTFVAAAIMQLVEQGKLSLDTKLKSVLPYFHMADPRYLQITIEQMLSHTSGIPDILDYTWDPPEYDDGALARYVRSMGKEKLVFAPGEKFVYSNTAYDILGQVIAEMSGQLFEDYIAAHILHPLGMKDSTFLYSNASPELLSSPYLSLPNIEASPLYPYTRAHAPCGSLHTNVIDLSAWAIANLNKGRYGKIQILSPLSHALLWQPRIAYDEENPDEFVGLCWFIARYRDEQRVSHSGGDLGFNTLLTLLPERSIGVVVLANTYPAPTQAITEVILDTFLGFEPRYPKPPIIQVLSPVLKDKGLEAAIEIYRQIKESQPDDYDFTKEQFFNIGYTLIDIKRLAEAKDVLRLGIEINPEADNLYYELARAAMLSGENEQAVQYCRQSLAINPKNWEADRLLHELI